MKQMFQSATLKLTAWYLAILMTISITFSVVIYQLNYREVSNRLQNLQLSLTDDMSLVITGQNKYGYGPGSAFFSESQKAGAQMALSLVYINAVIFVAGGLGSYFLARRTLKPIEESHEAQSRFTSDASHELRTPLAAMKAELEVTLRDQNLTIEESKEVLESNLEEVEKLISLSQMLLQLSRLEHNKLDFQRLDLVALNDDVLRRYSQYDSRFVLTTRKNAFAYGSEPAVTEVMTILIDNALKYSAPDSPITIRVFEKLGFVGYEITNQGIKIPEHSLTKLFDRFYRADSSRTDSSKNGYGLGLAIAKKIVDIHHGEISVTSNDESTAFTVLLPKRTQRLPQKLQQKSPKA